MTSAAAGRSDLDGVLLLNKPRGLSSQQAVSRVKWLLQARKAGHTGTLDPMADGLLPLGFGEATKFTRFLLDADKCYLATLRLGISTTTGDAEGDPVGQSPVTASREQIESILKPFLGQQTQIPPMHAAIKVDGKPLYAYARSGKSVDRKPRNIFINEIELIDYKYNLLTIRVSCSKGTYIRVLAEDIGKALGCGAHLTALTRERAGVLTLSSAISIAELEGLDLQRRREKLLPVDTFAAELPRLDLDAEPARRLLMGQEVLLPTPGLTGLLRLYGGIDGFLGVGEACGNRLHARRLLASAAKVVSGQKNLSNPGVKE